MKALKLILRVLLTAALVGALLHFVDWQKVAGALARARLGWMVAAFLLVIVGRAVQAGQLTLILRFVGSTVSWFRVFRAGALGAFYAQITPGGVASAVAKWTDLSAATQNRSRVANAILYHRILLDLQPLLIGAAALAWSNPTGEPILAIATGGLAALGLAGAIALYSRRLPVPLVRLAEAASHRLPGAAGRGVGRLLHDLDAFRGFTMTRHLSAAGVGLLAFGFRVAARLCLIRALGFSVPLTTIIWVDALLIVAFHLPITLSNFGVREGLVIAAFGLHGIPADVAFAYGLLIYACQLPMSLVGGTYQLALIAGWAKMKDETVVQGDSAVLGESAGGAR